MNSHQKVGVITSSLSRQSGGLYDAMRYLYRTMSTDKLVFGLKDAYTQTDQSGWGKVVTHAFPVKALPFFGWSPKLDRALQENHLDILHLHGLWMYPQYVSLRWQNKTKRPVVISPHGMLDLWAVKNSYWKKKLVGYLFANRSLHQANCLHALCESEYRAIRDFGLKSPVAVIPNGIDMPKNFKKEFHHKTRTLLFVGRIHPKKGLMNLVNALERVNYTSPTFFKTWKIKIAGWDQGGHLEELKIKCKKEGLMDMIEFAGPLYGIAKEEALKNADAFILPSYSEGLPMSVLEAWAYQLPVIMTKECNLPEGFKSGAALEIALDPKDIASKLMEMDSWSRDQFETMGTKAYNLVSRKFTWEKIARDMAETYDWLLNKKPPPEFVRFD